MSDSLSGDAEEEEESKGDIAKEIDPEPKFESSLNTRE